MKIYLKSWGKRPISVLNDLCKWRPCLQPHPFRNEVRCITRDNHGCPQPTPPPNPCCSEPKFPPSKYRRNWQKCRSCGTKVSQPLLDELKGQHEALGAQ